MHPEIVAQRGTPNTQPATAEFCTPAASSPSRWHVAVPPFRHWRVTAVLLRHRIGVPTNRRGALLTKTAPTTPERGDSATTLAPAGRVPRGTRRGSRSATAASWAAVALAARSTTTPSTRWTPDCYGAWGTTPSHCIHTRRVRSRSMSGPYTFSDRPTAYQPRTCVACMSGGTNHRA
jgi:hypothetical protein